MSGCAEVHRRSVSKSSSGDSSSVRDSWSAISLSALAIHVGDSSKPYARSNPVSSRRIGVQTELRDECFLSMRTTGPLSMWQTNICPPRPWRPTKSGARSRIAWSSASASSSQMNTASLSEPPMRARMSGPHFQKRHSPPMK